MIMRKKLFQTLGKRGAPPLTYLCGTIRNASHQFFWVVFCRTAPYGWRWPALTRQTIYTNCGHFLILSIFFSAQIYFGMLSSQMILGKPKVYIANHYFVTWNFFYVIQYSLLSVYNVCSDCSVRLASPVCSRLTLLQLVWGSHSQLAQRFKQKDVLICC